MDDPPEGWDASGPAGGGQGECIWAEFGAMAKNRIDMATLKRTSAPVSDRITAFLSGGMMFASRS